MPRLLIGSFLFYLLFAGLLGQNTPPTLNLLAPSGVVEGGYSNMAVIASDSEGDSLTYSWSVSADPTGHAGFFVSPDVVSTVANRTSVQFAIKQGPSYPNPSFFGQVVTFQLQVSDGTNVVTELIPVTVNGVNRPPILDFDITGLGTQANPRLAGQGLAIDASGSRDPDGSSVKMLFLIESARFGSVCPNSGSLVLLGKETHHPGMEVPKVTALPSAPMEIVIRVIVEDGLFTHQQIFTGYLASPNGCSGGGPTLPLSASPTASPNGPTVGQTVTLRANASGGRSPYNFTWNQLSNSAGVSITNSTRATAQFVAPSTPQVLTMQLQVRDADQDVITRNLQVSVLPQGSGGGGGGGGDEPGVPSGQASGTVVCSSQSNQPGEANLPASYTITGGNTATITATNGRDPDNTQVVVNGIPITGVNYNWNFTNGAGILTNGALSGNLTNSVSFAVPNVAQVTNAALSVLVNDAAGCGTRYTTNIVINPGQSNPNPNPNNNPPTASLTYQVNSGAVQNSSAQAVTLVAPATVLLDGSGSSDSDGTINVAFNLQNSLTNGSASLTQLPNSGARLEVDSGSVGSLSVTMTVTDDDAATASITQSFTIEEPDVIPVAVATVMSDGSDLGVSASVSEGAMVILDGSGSNLPEGDSESLTYRWRQVSGPAVSLMDSEEEQASFRAPQSESANTALRFELLVYNGATPSEPVFVEVTIVIPALYFSQVAFGPVLDELFRTVIVLVNSQDDDAEEVTIEFFNQAGEPLAVEFNGEPWSPEEPFRLGSTVSRRFEFSAQDEDLTTVGWARIRADVRLTGLVLYQLVDSETRHLNSEVSLLATQRGSRFTTFFGVEDGLAAAIANPGATEARLIVKLIDEDFGPDLPLVTKPIILQPGQQLATFLDESYFGFLPPDFEQGTLLVETISGRVAMTVLKTQEGVAISTLPLARR